ncbi:MAG: hypothetical protein R2731_19600 [Nocardioides sp.]
MRDFAGAVSAADGSVTSWAPTALCDNCRVRDLAVDSGTVLGAVGGEPGGRAAAWSAADGGLLWTKEADGEVQAVAARAGTAYFGGHFSVRFGAYARSQLAAVDVASGSVLSFAPRPAAMRSRASGRWMLAPTRCAWAAGSRWPTRPTSATCRCPRPRWRRCPARWR